MTIESLRAALHQAVMSTIQPKARKLIPGILDAIGVPSAPDDPSLSKREYIDSRLDLLSSQDTPAVVEKILARQDLLILSGRFELEELLWSVAPTISINRRSRYEVAKALKTVRLFVKHLPFLELVRQLWERTSPLDVLWGGGDDSLSANVERHFVCNPNDWTVEHLFEQLGAFNASDRRFALFIEGLASPEVRPDEASQREFVTVINSALVGSSVELREVSVEGGFPVFRFASLGGGAGRPKNLIFASQSKPDLRFRDAINNDIEIVSRAEDVLVYDRPLPVHGLRWSDLQSWWADTHNVDEKNAKATLYRRLLKSLPRNSPQQVLMFKEFFKTFAQRVHELPALLPEVWLHWDPKTVRERGPEALTGHRMDLLMLFSHDIRIVIEVDGKHHYSDNTGMGSPLLYAKMVSADRTLRLSGYEVYRFGAAELDEVDGPARIRDFFERLFKRYGVIKCF